MAGEFPVQAKSSTKRKQWKIYRGHRGPFRRLITELTEDGSPDSQVMYAKQLFEDSCCEEDEQAEENAKLGVYWLLRASEQGHEEATRMLQHCLHTGRGITPFNVQDVRNCLDTPLDERISRHAAREIFASLSQGEDYITTDQLSEEMIKVRERGGSERRSVDADSSASTSAVAGQSVGSKTHHSDSLLDRTTTHSPIGGGGRQFGKCERLTEEMLVSAASQHCHGYLPLLHASLTLDPPQPPQSTLTVISRFPFRHLISSYSRLVDTFGGGGGSSVMSGSVVDIYLPVILGCLYSVFGLDGILELLPTLLYYFTLLTLIISTCQILCKKWELSHFTQWSNLLVAYGGDGVRACDAQWQHCLNNLRPCFTFLIALLINLSTLPFLPLHALPHSELAALSVLSSLTLLYNFMWWKGKLDIVMLVSFGTHVFARYPYDSDAVVSQGWRFIDVHVPSFSSYIMSNGIEFCLNFRLLLYAIVIMLMIGMSARDGWRGFFTSLVPHVVCLSWWQLAVISSHGATWYGLIRSILGLCGAVLFLPLAGLSTILLPLAAVLRYMAHYLPLPATIALASAGLTTACYLRKYTSTRHVSTIQWMFMLISMYVLVSYSGDVDPEYTTGTSSLSYPQYLSMCAHPRSSAILQAPSQTRCLLTQGVSVSWEGTILSTRVSSVHNPLATIFSRLPQKLEDTMTCIYGDRFTSDCLSTDTTCNPMPSALINKCHLSKWNRYEYEIEVSVSNGGRGGIWGGSEPTDTALLIAGNSFKNMTLSLSRGDKLWFTGRLSPSGDGGDMTRPEIRLVSAGCVACTKDLIPVHDTLVQQSDLSLILSTSLNSLLHFLLSPLYSTFKPYL